MFRAILGLIPALLLGIILFLINPILGGQIIFCVDRFSQSSTMEQLDLKTVKAVIDNMKKI